MVNTLSLWMFLALFTVCSCKGSLLLQPQVQRSLQHHEQSMGLMQVEESKKATPVKSSTALQALIPKSSPEFDNGTSGSQPTKLRGDVPNGIGMTETGKSLKNVSGGNLMTYPHFRLVIGIVVLVLVIIIIFAL